MATELQSGYGAGGHGERPGFAELLRRYRRAADLTQEKLADAAEVAVRTVRNLESDRSARPHPRTVRKLARGLGLTDDQAANLIAAGDADRAAHRQRSAGLPPDVPAFTGRHAELDRLLTRARQPDGGTVVVHGQPGVGKTSVVLHAAHQLIETFDGDVYFVDLRGVDAVPLSTDYALDQLLAGLHGDRGGQAASTTGERLVQYRRLTMRREGLLVLDNAANEAQVRPLLPAGPHWRVFISSRRALGGLVGVERMLVHPCSFDEAHELLAGVLGADRLGADPEASALLIELCGRLPLALRIVGNRIAMRPDWTVAELVDRMRDERRRLDLLYSGDLQVRSAFAVSYRQLRVPARRVLRRLPLLGWPDYSADAVALLVDTSVAAAEEILDTLVEAGLLATTATSGRYVLHDLMAVFAAERLASEESSTDRDRARARVRTWLLATVTEAGRWLDPERAFQREQSGAAAGTARFASERDAASWLTTEQDAWWWAVQQAADGGQHREVIDAAHALYWFSDRYHLAISWTELFALAVRAAETLGDRGAEAAQRNALGWSLAVVLDRPDDGLAQYQRALALATSVGDLSTVGWAHAFICGAHHRTGDIAAAVAPGTRAVEIMTEVGDWSGRIVSTCALAKAHHKLGDIDRALSLLHDIWADWSSASTDQRAHQHLGGWIQVQLGSVYAGLHRHAEAAAAFTAAIDDFADDYPLVSGDAQLALAEVLISAGDPRADGVLRRAALTFRQNDDEARLEKAEQLRQRLAMSPE